jgi:hypothetical protein
MLPAGLEETASEPVKSRHDQLKLSPVLDERYFGFFETINAEVHLTIIIHADTPANTQLLIY